MRYSIVALAFATGITASPAFAGAVNLITDGDFTQLSKGVGQITDGYNVTSATGWTSPGYNFVMSVADKAVNTQYGAANLALWDAANGGSNTWDGKAGVGNFLAMDADYNTGPVHQTVSGLTVGETYVLNFDYAFAQQKGYDGATTQKLEAFVQSDYNASSPTWTSATESLANHGFSGWMTENMTFKATSTSEVVSFLAGGSPQVPPFTLVSDVSLMAGAPEPPTWAMMLAGFVGLSYAGFRGGRRKQAALLA